MSKPRRWTFVPEEFTDTGEYQEGIVGDDATGLILARIPPGWDTEENGRLMAAAPAMAEALEEIAKGEGAFSRDPLEHASNTIESMRALALAALEAARGRG